MGVNNLKEKLKVFIKEKHINISDKSINKMFDYDRENI